MRAGKTPDKSDLDGLLRWCGALLTVASLLLSTMACSPRSPAESPKPVERAETVAQPRLSEWDALIAEARKEGTVVIATSLRPQATDATRAAFKAKYGIDIEWIVGRGGELAAKLAAERNAGLYLVDFGMIGSTTYSGEIKPMKITMPLEPLLVLPEVKDPKNWRNGVLPFYDEAKQTFAVLSVATPFYHRNTDLVKDGEITSSMDLLNPKWKDKLVLSDPSLAGGSNAWFTWTLEGVLGKDKGMQFMKGLAAQNVMVTRDERLLTEWIARGKYPIGIGPSISVPAEFIQKGAPIAFIDVKEPRPLSAGSGVIYGFTRAPHPNAARLFLNWLLSKEGSSIFAPASEYPSTRTDVPPTGILPILVPRPDDADVEAKFEYIGIRSEMRKVASDIFSPLMK